MHRGFFCFVIFRSRVEDWIVLVVVVASLNYIFPAVVLVLAVGLDCVVVLIVAASLGWVVVVVASLGWTVKYGFCELEHLGVVLIGESDPFGHRCGTLI